MFSIEQPRRKASDRIACPTIRDADEPLAGSPARSQGRGMGKRLPSLALCVGVSSLCVTCSTSPSAPTVGGCVQIAGCGLHFTPGRPPNLEVNPPIPSQLRVGQSVLITVTLFGDDATGDKHVEWRTSRRVASWVTPDPPCDQDSCATVRALAPTDIALPGEVLVGPNPSVTLTISVCPPNLHGFDCPFRNFDLKIVE